MANIETEWHNLSVGGLPVLSNDPRIYEWKLLYPVSFRVLDIKKACFTRLLSSKESKWIQYLGIFCINIYLIWKRPISARQPMLAEAFLFTPRKVLQKCKCVFSILCFSQWSKSSLNDAPQTSDPYVQIGKQKDVESIYDCEWKFFYW